MLLTHDWVPSDPTLLALKYIGSTFAAGYGVYATVTDFKEDRNGRKVLSKKGVWGIVLLFVSILLNTSSDAFKDLRDRAKAEEEKKSEAKAAADQKQVSDELAAELDLTRGLNTQLGNTGRELRKTSATTDLVLKEARRATDPFSRADIDTFNVGYRIPTNEPTIQEYLKRIRSEAYASDEGIVKPEPGTLLMFRPDSPGFPNFARPSELALAMRVHLRVVKLTFQRKGIAHDLTRIPDLLLQGVKGPSLEALISCGPDSHVGYLVPDSRNPNNEFGLRFICQGTKINWTDYGGGFRSYQDFQNATVTIELESSTSHTMTNYRLSDIFISTHEQRKIELAQPAICVTREHKFLAGPAVDCLGVLKVH
jgi:hypothetical protein